MFKIPKVGSHVRVTIDYTSSMRGFAQCVPRKRIIVGQVHRNDTWVDEDSFTLYTGLPGYPISIIHRSLVADLEHLDGTVNGEEEEKAPDVSVESFQIPGSKGNTYTVTHHGTQWECTCIAGQHGRACKHIAAAKLNSIARTSVSE